MRALELDNATVVITGGARGIGRASAELFAARGAAVCIGDLDGAADAAGEIGAGTRGYELDVADPDSFRGFVARVEEEVGSPDVLVNNAGIMPLGSFLDEDEATARATIEVNLWGVITGMRAVLPGMVDRGHGHVINVASMMGKLHIPGAAVYGATKHAVVGLSAAVRDEVAGSGVSITAILPTAVKTELVAGVPLGRGLPSVEPGQVAEAIVESCEGRPAEVHVPRWLAAYEPAVALVPGRVIGALRKLIGHDRVLTDLDGDERAEYDERIAGERSEQRS